MLGGAASVALAGCGGSHAGTASSAPGTQGSARQAAVASPKSPGAPKRIPVKVPKTGDRSIQTYGSAPSEADFVAVADAVRRFDVAVASRDTRDACGLLASSVKRGILLLYRSAAARGNGGTSAHPSCVTVLALLFRSQPASYRVQLRRVRVTDARLKRDTGFAIVQMPGAPQSALPVRRENGRWLVAGLGGTPLS